MSLNRISRRDALVALGLAAMSEARADGGLLRATRVDHVSLAVGDIDKALVFYRSLFGNEVLKDSRTPRRYLRLGPCYMAIAPAAAGEAKRIDHVGIGTDSDLLGYDRLPVEMYRQIKSGYKSSYAFRDKIDTDGFNNPDKMFSLTDALLRRGYSEANVLAVLGGNFRRLLATAWKAK